MKLEYYEEIDPKSVVILKRDGTFTNLHDLYNNIIGDKKLLNIFQGDRRSLYKIGNKINPFTLDCIVIEHWKNHDEYGIKSYTSAIKIPDEEHCIDVAQQLELTKSIVANLGEVLAIEFAESMSSIITINDQRIVENLISTSRARKANTIIALLSNNKEPSDDLVRKINLMSRKNLNDLSKFIYIKVS